MSLETIKAEYATVATMIETIDDAIAIVSGKAKKYQYSNIETVHMAETQSLSELVKTRDYYQTRKTAIENQLTTPFVKFKNFP